MRDGVGGEGVPGCELCVGVGVGEREDERDGVGEPLVPLNARSAAVIVSAHVASSRPVTSPCAGRVTKAPCPIAAPLPTISDRSSPSGSGVG